MRQRLSKRGVQEGGARRMRVAKSHSQGSTPVESGIDLTQSFLDRQMLDADRAEIQRTLHQQTSREKLPSREKKKRCHHKEYLNSLKSDMFVVFGFDVD
jgi:hypothetical protein